MRLLLLLCIILSMEISAIAHPLDGSWPLITSSSTTAVTINPTKLQPNSTARIFYRNDSLTGHSLNAHYGFNGWSLAVPGFASIEFEARHDWYKDVPMTWDADRQSFFVDIFIPKDARALHFVFCWDDCSNGKWDSNNSKDYAWPIVFPYAGPFLTWNADTKPESGMVINFEDTFATEAWLDFWQEGSSVRKRIIDEPRAVHRFILNNLLPGTHYRYRLGTGDTFVSPEYVFRTHDGSNSFSFIALSDIQDSGEWCAFSKVKTQLQEHHNDALFYMFAGDFVWNNHPGLWWTAFDSAKDIMATHAFMAVPGNHDTPGTASNSDISVFNYYFNPPSNLNTGGYQFFVGSSLFLALNSEVPSTFAPGGLQYNWLSQKLRERKANTHNQISNAWTFAYWHIPAWDSAKRHAGQQLDFRAAADLFPGVLDWHFTGHEHMYQRMNPIGLHGVVESSYGLGINQGTGFTVLPSAGAWPEAGISQSPGAPYAFAGYSGAGTDSGNGFVRIDINGAQALLSTYMLKTNETPELMRLVDQVHLQK